MRRIPGSVYLFIWVLALICLLVADCQGGVPQPAHTLTPTPAGTATITPTRVQLITGAPTLIPTPTQVPIRVDSASLKSAQITLWHPLSGDSRAALEALIRTFNQSNPWGIQAQASQVGDSQTLYAQLEDGLIHSEYDALPNLILAGPDQIAGLNDQDAIITNLAPYIADPQFGFSNEEKAAIPDAFWAPEHGPQGMISGLPALRTAHVLFYNLTWAKELGFNTPPATPDDFRLQACAAAKAVTADGNPDDAGTGGWITATDANTLLSWMYAYGGVDLPVRISQPYHFDTPNNQKALAFFNSLFADGCAWNSRQPTPYDYFAKRQALMVSGDLQDVAVQARMQAHDSSKDEWTVIPYPSLSQKQPVLVSGLSFGIMRHGDTPDLAAWLLARWLNQPENQARLSQASGLLPANKATFNNLTDYENTYPQWKEAELWTDVYQPAPGIGSWQAAHLVLADMGWQVFHPRTPPDSPSTLLSELDQSINDVLIHKP